MELGARYSDTGADELVFLDITATIRSRKTIVDSGPSAWLRRSLFRSPLGAASAMVDQIDELLRSGAEKVSVNTAAVQNPDLLAEAAQRFGNQCVVLAIDARRSKTQSEGHWQVCVKAGSEPTDTRCRRVGPCAEKNSVPVRSC